MDVLLSLFGIFCQRLRHFEQIFREIWQREDAEKTAFLRAILCKSHPTCDSSLQNSSNFNQLKMKVILEYGRNFSFIKHLVKFLGGSRDNSSFSRNAISGHKLYFESPLSLLELLFRVQVTSTN